MRNGNNKIDCPPSSGDDSNAIFSDHPDGCWERIDTRRWWDSPPKSVLGWGFCWRAARSWSYIAPLGEYWSWAQNLPYLLLNYCLNTNSREATRVELGRLGRGNMLVTLLLKNGKCLVHNLCKYVGCTKNKNLSERGQKSTGTEPTSVTKTKVNRCT